MSGKAGKGLLHKIASYIAKRVDRSKEKYPKKKVKNRVAIISFILTGLPLFLVLFIIHGAYSIIDVFANIGLITAISVQIVFVLLYISVVVFIIFEIKSWWDLIDIVYEPVRTMEERTSDKLLEPVRKFMIKMDLIIAAIMMAIFMGIIILILIRGFTPILILPVVVTLIVGGVLIGASILIYLVFRSILVFLFDVLWRKLDNRFHITDSMRRKWDDLNYVDIDELDN